MPGASGPMWASVDRATHPENSSAKPGTAHGSGRSLAVTVRTVATAATDTNTATSTNITPLSIPHAEPFTLADVRPDASEDLPAPVTRLDRTREP